MGLRQLRPVDLSQIRLRR